MKTNNQLALIVSYYLSRFDKDGYASLGYSTFSHAADSIGNILGVKPNTIKNMRDEFDPHHENTRIGWLRELRGSRLKVLRAFQETDENTLLEIVKEILNNNKFKETEEYKDIQILFDENRQDSNKKASVFIVRGPTGKAAEQYFIEYFKKCGEPVKGKLRDVRDFGGGYDFEIINSTGSYYVEVKGLSASSGGILFTSKEWQVATEYKEKYYVALIMNISNIPQIKFIQNPTKKLKAKKNIYSTIQLSWSVSQKDLDLLQS